ncbi:MAG TPA: rRNA maturation RNase YbeY [Campylobacterales bacterium]|nr:rRNA maturation RNase YbeY [Campylobacterales bacterium]HHC11095.1 rRNA maturation RNase YbeY [Campylobacterales bacterium]HHD80574.1 rRNA maturation RNase YbeY [Campylobacterales bacterium]
MLNIENLTNTEININRLEDIAEKLTHREIDLTICDNTLIKKYNHQYRNIDKATDVLSFPLEGNFDNMPLGSIVISADFVKEKSDEFAHSQTDELTLLFIHGLLHLLGYDHEIDSGQMRTKEKEIINMFNLPKSLIVRVEEG